VKAVVAVESGRLGGFDKNTRRPIILFEPHVFSRETGGDFDASHPLISYAGWGKRPYPRTQAERWTQLHQAMALDPGAALSSASWGAFQVMGFNHRACGFGTAWAFARAMASGSRAQLDAAANYILHRRLDDELREGRWAAFALAWNGPGFAKHDYDGRLAAENRRAAAWARCTRTPALYPCTVRWAFGPLVSSA
jgi:hypothetical protein